MKSFDWYWKLYIPLGVKLTGLQKLVAIAAGAKAFYPSVVEFENYRCAYHFWWIAQVWFPRLADEEAKAIGLPY